MESAVWVGIFVIIKGIMVRVSYQHPETISTQAEGRTQTEPRIHDEEFNKGESTLLIKSWPTASTEFSTFAACLQSETYAITYSGLISPCFALHPYERQGLGCFCLQK